MDDTTRTLIKFYQDRVAALEAALKAAEEERDALKEERDMSKEMMNDMIDRATHLYHQTQRQLFI